MNIYIYIYIYICTVEECGWVGKQQSSRLILIEIANTPHTPHSNEANDRTSEMSAPHPTTRWAGVVWSMALCGVVGWGGVGADDFRSFWFFSQKP